MSRQIVKSNLAPITWSTVDEAFELINDNFSELYGSLGLALSLTSLPSSLIPDLTNSYDIGSPTLRWKDLYLGSSIVFQNSTIFANLDGSVALPAGSTVGGNTVLTNVNSFSSVQISGGSTLEADGSSDTLTLIPGSNISIVSDSVANTITFSSSFGGSLSDLSDTVLSSPSPGQVLKYNGTAWVNSEDETGGGGGEGLASRNTASGSTGTISNGSSANVTIAGYKGYLLYKIQTSAAAWVRIYTSTAARTTDSSRLEGVDPLPGAGVIAEVITTGNQSILISPGTVGFNDELIPNSNIEIAVTNKSGSTADITVTLTVLKVED